MIILQRPILLVIRRLLLFTYYVCCRGIKLQSYIVYIAQSDYGLNVDASFLSKYRVVSCVYKGKQNFYAFLKYTDCLNYDEFICLYRFVVYYVKRNKLPKHISLQEFCLLIDFLCRSRFAGHLGHDKVEGINFLLKYLVKSGVVSYRMVFLRILIPLRSLYVCEVIINLS